MRFNALALILSFTIGIMFMMFTTPRPKVVIKFPTPEMDINQVFRTEQGSCYKVETEQVSCPEKNVRPQPVGDHEEVVTSDWTAAFGK